MALMKKRKAPLSQKEEEEEEEEMSLNFSDEEERREIAESRKKLHSAKTLLKELTTTTATNSDSEDVDAKELDKSLISTRILKATAQAQGRRIYDMLAANVNFSSGGDVGRGCSHFRGSPVAVAISPDGRFVFSGWSTGAVRKYDRKIGRVINHFSPLTNNKNNKNTNLKNNGSNVVTALALSPSGSYLAVGRKDGKIDLYDAVSHRPAKVPTGVFSHHGSITALCFGPEDSRLYSSAAQDRTIKVWQVTHPNDDAAKKNTLILSFIDTLYGHQDVVPALASISEDRCLSVGGRDRTARLWKIVEESQLLFRSSPDQDGDELVCIASLSESVFVTAGSSSLALWSHGRKKPLFRVLTERSIISLATLPGSDLVAVGDQCGMVSIYQFLPEAHELALLHSINCNKLNNQSNGDCDFDDEDNCGLINSLAWAFDEDTHSLTLAAAYGREPRLHRLQVVSVSPRVYTFSWSVFSHHHSL